MNETTRTLTFVGVAVVLAAAAFGMHAVNRPPSLEEFSDVGEEFYPDFDNPRDATGLRVAAYNEDAARAEVFNVEFKNGLWRIPSHHDYPADGEERLANTATSIIGLQREALVSTSADDHKRLGVLDPLDEEVTGTEGRGDRITLTRGEDVLADYIVGDRIEDGPENTFHVRRADENRTYRVTLNLDISTKFADWIEPDLLEFQRGQIRELVIDRYSVDETQGVVDPGVRSVLSRSSLDDPWKLEGIDEQTQQVKVSTVNQMITALDDLKIVGVRPKPTGLSATLRGEGNGINDLERLDLERKGFFLDPRGMLFSNEGDFQLATADGARYVLRFGEVFTGSDVEIEVGTSSPADGDEAAADEQADDEQAPDADQTDAEASDENAEKSGEDASTDSGTRRSRYVFITAEFDESLIEPLPEKPVRPEPPEGVKPQEGDESEADDAAATDDAPADENDDADADKPADDAAPAEQSDEADADADKPGPQEQYEQALAAYEQELKNWETQQKEREAKLEEGQQQVQELNDRFADWYYVISAETFDKIRVAPEELVEPVEQDDEDAADAQATPPAPPGLPAIDPADEKQMPAEPDAEAEKPASESTEKSTDDTPADAGDEAETPDADKSATDDKPAEDKPGEEAAEKPADAPQPAESTDQPPADESAGPQPAPEESAGDES